MPFRIEMPDYELEQQLLKYDNTAILVIGPQEWYDNLSAKYAEYGETWLQNSKKLNSVVIDYFNTKISNHNFFAIYGYVTLPECQICYRFKIGKILSKGIKSPPPDKTVGAVGSNLNIQHMNKMSVWLVRGGAERQLP